MTFSTADATALLAEGFAPWVQDLHLTFDHVSADTVVMRMPFSDRLCRMGGMVCGQAFMAMADTAAVFALAAAAGQFVPCTTVDMTTHMMRPISSSDVLARTSVLRRGRTMAWVEVQLRADGDDRPAVQATSTLAIMSG